MKQTTTVIPIVFAVGIDSVATGLVTSLAKPGGNVTGLSTQAADLASKRLDILREVVPSAHCGGDGQCRQRATHAGGEGDRGRRSRTWPPDEVIE